MMVKSTDYLVQTLVLRDIGNRASQAERSVEGERRHLGAVYDVLRKQLKMMMRESSSTSLTLFGS